MACERRRDMETNLNLNGSDDEITNKPGNGKGRRRSKLNNEPAQKKKKPQRGMGVAKLEKMRVQENDNMLKNQLHSLTLQNYQFGTTPCTFADPPVQMHLAKLGSYGATHSGLNQALLLQRLGTGGFQLDPYGLIRSGSNSTAHNNVGSTLIETSARDQLCKVPSVKCYSEQCGICHKKKRINGGNFFCNGARKMYIEMPQINGSNFTGFNVRNNQEFGRNQQEAEVVAVHRKQGINTGGGGGSVVMEYEFFPGKGSCCSNNNNSNEEEEEEEEELMMMKVGSESSSLVGGGGGGVDLSLKLSY